MLRLTSPDDIETILAADAAIVFKNSMTCPISAAARREMQTLLDRRPDAPLYLVDVHQAVMLSEELADRTGIEHESPQVIVFSRGTPVWHASHYAVRAADVERVLEGSAAAAR